MPIRKFQIENQKKVIGYSNIRTGINLLHIGLTSFIVVLIIYVWVNHKKIFKKLLTSILDTVESEEYRIQTILDKHIKKSFEPIDVKLKNITTDISKTMEKQTQKMDETLEKRQNQQPTTQPTTQPTIQPTTQQTV